MDLPGIIEVSCLHTPEMIAAELAGMLAPRPLWTPGRLLRLWLAQSPFLTGAPLTGPALLQAQEILATDAGPDAIAAELTTALRAFSLIKGTRAQADDAAGLGPEWLADLYAAVCRAGAMDWEYFLWRLPLVAAAHLAGSAHRAAGGVTERPLDWDRVTKELESYGRA